MAHYQYDKLYHRTLLQMFGDRWIARNQPDNYGQSLERIDTLDQLAACNYTQETCAQLLIRILDKVIGN